PEQLPAVSHQVKGNAIVLRWPSQAYKRETTSKYTAQTWPNARLAGLLTEDGEEDLRRLVPLLFAEVRLTPPASRLVPPLRSSHGDGSWPFVWGGRLARGFLLVVPRLGERHEVRFEGHWDDPRSSHSGRLGRPFNAASP